MKLLFFRVGTMIPSQRARPSTSLGVCERSRSTLALHLLAAVAGLMLPLSGRAEDAAAAPLGSAFYDWSGLPAKPVPTGAYRKVADGPTPTLQRLEFHISTLLPGRMSHPPHHHPQEELVLIKDGTLEATINGKSQRVGPGSLLFFAAHDVHNVLNVGTVPSTYYVINFYTDATAQVREQAAATWAPPGMLPSSVIDWEKLVPQAGPTDVRRKLIDSPTLTFKRLEIHATTVQPGAPASQLHRHPWPMLVVMKEGYMEAKIDGVSGRFGPGSILLIAANAQQSLRNPADVPATYFVFSVSSANVPTS
jgi:uncharacterized cupin superfamily protein